MGSIRHFDGSRPGNKHSAASEVTRFEIQNGIKLPPAERYKRILKKKFEEHKNGALMAQRANKKMPSTLLAARKLSKKAEEAMKQMAAKKAAKEAKAERMRVYVQAMNFNNGKITKDGKIFDLVGNLVGKVDTKTGNMKNMQGWGFGKYKRKSYYTNMLIQDSINKFSPHFIKLRKMQELERAGLLNPTQDVLNTYCNSQQSGNFCGEAAGGPRQNIGFTAHGMTSDNVWGTMSDNVWGRSMDNVWGTNTTDTWGHVGGNPYGNTKMRQIWGSGNGVNHLKKLTNFIAGLFGLKNKQTVDAFRQHAQNRAQNNAGASAPRAPAGGGGRR